MAFTNLKTTLLNLLKQGTTPKGLAQCFALGLTVGIMPFWGFTTIGCTALAWRLRLNLVAIHIANGLATVLQVLVFVPYMQLGVKLFGLPSVFVGFSELQLLWKQSATIFFEQFGKALLAANFVWLISFPLVFYSFYALFYFLFHKINARIKS